MFFHNTHKIRRPHKANLDMAGKILTWRENSAASQSKRAWNAPWNAPSPPRIFSCRHDNVMTTRDKKGEWIPVYKKEDRLDKVNYRPITVLAAVKKIFEQLICRQLSEMFEPIFNPFLSAYRKHFNCNTETILIRLIEDCKHEADKSHAVVVLSTDMSIQRT